MKLTAHSKHIRPAAYEDAAEIAALIFPYLDDFAVNSQGQEKLNQQAITALIENESVHYYVYAPDQQILGIIAFNASGHLIHFFTAQFVLRQGIGGKLWRFAQYAMFGLGVESISVNSSCAAQPIYERFGFHAVSALIESSGLRFIQMRKDLKPDEVQCEN